MSVFIFLLVVTLFCSLLIWTKILIPRRQLARQHRILNVANQRPLTEEEKRACKAYLNQLYPTAEDYYTRLLVKLRLLPRSDQLLCSSVYQLSHSITRYGLSTRTPQSNRYYLDAAEVLLPATGIPFIAAENSIELVYTQQIPLIITLNGQSLIGDNGMPPSPTDTAHSTSSILNEKRDHVEIVNVRRQTVEEYSLNHTNSISVALTLCAAMLLIFCSLLTPLRVMPWLLLASLCIILVSIWILYRRPRPSSLQEIRAMRGVPKPWGLFGEAHQQHQNISLGVLDLHYPEYWYPYLQADIGHETIIEIDPHNRVVRHGSFLSLDNEANKFPLQKWRHNLVLAIGSLLILLMTASCLPTSISFKISMAWFQGMQRINVKTVEQLNSRKLQVGDLIRVNSQGRCTVPSTYQSNRSYEFLPFDCSTVYWNTTLPHPTSVSNTVDFAKALLKATSQQINSPDGNRTVNPLLASAIQRSGMVLLNNFSDIVLKTAELCRQEYDCPRLKSALVNLENAKNWPSLVSKAQAGKLAGLNVLLRPNSAENLINLAKSSATSFISNETRSYLENLAHIPNGGYLLINGQGRTLVDQEQPDISLFDLEPTAQWQELKRLSTLFLDTPFSITGIITSLHKDNQGTLHIVVHNEPTSTALWRHLVIALFLACLVVLILLNTGLSIYRLRADYTRSARIQEYYDYQAQQSAPLSLHQRRE